MLGLVLLYWIGKYFYLLAEEFNKSKWGFAILGVVTYYAGVVFVGIILGIVEVFANTTFLETTNDLILGLIFAPFGILACYLLYMFLEKKWKAQKPKTDVMIDNIGE